MFIFIIRNEIFTFLHPIEAGIFISPPLVFVDIHVEGLSGCVGDVAGVVSVSANFESIRYWQENQEPTGRT